MEGKGMVEICVKGFGVCFHTPKGSDRFGIDSGDVTEEALWVETAERREKIPSESETGKGKTATFFVRRDKLSGLKSDFKSISRFPPQDLTQEWVWEDVPAEIYLKEVFVFVNCTRGLPSKGEQDSGSGSFVDVLSVFNHITKIVVEQREVKPCSNRRGATFFPCLWRKGI